MMTVAELVKLLQGLPQEMPVVAQKDAYPQDYFGSPDVRIEPMVISGARLTTLAIRRGATEHRGDMVTIG